MASALSLLIFLFYFSETSEYHNAVKQLDRLAQEHMQSLVPGTPQFDWCDDAVMVSW